MMIKTNNLFKRSPKLKQLPKFTFVGGGSKLNRSLVREAPVFTNPNSMLLNAVQINKWVAISEIDTDRNTSNYLKQLGFKLQTNIKVISHTASGSVIVSIGENQIGLGSEITQKVVVTLVSEQK